MHFCRHDRVRSIQQLGDVKTRLGIDNVLALFLTEQSDREQRNDDAQDASLGQAKQRSELSVKSRQLGPLDELSAVLASSAFYYLLIF